MLSHSSSEDGRVSYHSALEKNVWKGVQFFFSENHVSSLSCTATEELLYSFLKSETGLKSLKSRERDDSFFRLVNI